MNTRELNRRIHRLYRDEKLMQDTPDYWQYIEKTAKPEYKTLYNEDDKFERMSRRSILIMLVLNRRLRVITFHNFGIFINL